MQLKRNIIKLNYITLQTSTTRNAVSPQMHTECKISTKHDGEEYSICMYDGYEQYEEGAVRKSIHSEYTQIHRKSIYRLSDEYK